MYASGAPSLASTAVTKFIEEYFLDMELILSPERFQFSQVCFCLHHYCGNRPTFDIADTMWRILRALELDLAMSKECDLDSVFQYWHDKNIYFKWVRMMAMEVKPQLMDMRQSSMHTALIHKWGLSSCFHAHRSRFRTSFVEDGLFRSYLPKKILEPCLTELPEELESSPLGDGAAIKGYNR
ncbi:hypothetical protein B9Z19DRAFT_1134259 [Tuber borchii]|uniref:Uncharacterized protein n=1 Tax=Tuber borchii TaxID=42251 RepID=A0A2T6ZEJ7_TUBBO|nr:hypothetical protein B9Z19DRAFT_1134259 [Tuber borchii]